MLSVTLIAVPKRVLRVIERTCALQHERAIDELTDLYNILERNLKGTARHAGIRRDACVV